METTSESATVSSPVGTMTDRSHATVDRAAQSAHEAIDRLAAKAGPAIDRLRSSTSAAGATLKSRASDLSELEEQWLERTRDYVRENPLTSLGIAVLAGVVLSRLSSR